MNSRYNQILIFLLVVITAVLMNACANIAMPSGGPKDQQPPREVKSIPPNYSKNFDQKKVKIYFDEYVTLKDVANQVIISPPLTTMPEFNQKGKSVVIEFKEDYMENTTYTIFLGSAVADITEGNTMSNFEYVFASGNTLDSLSIQGIVINSFTEKPEKDILVMLYKDTYDSIPYKEKPYYLTRTGETGEFTINNLGEGKYKMFALRDENSNYLYDLSTEAIAFSDSLVEAEYHARIQTDTIALDSLVNTEIIIDTSEVVLNQLYLFEEPDTLQSLTRAYSPNEGMMVLIYRKSTIDPQIRVLNRALQGSWYIEDFNPGNDTLTYWITDLEIDTLIFEFIDNGEVRDTIEVTMASDKPDKQKVKRKERDQVKRLLLTYKAKTPFNYFSPLIINCSYPVIDYDFSDILLIEEEDTIQAKLIFDDEIKRKIRLDYEFKESTNYQLFIPDSVFTDIINNTNDTTIIKFRTNSVDDFGSLKLKINLPHTEESQYIIQLLDEKERILQQQFVTESKRIVYSNLKSGKYLIKAVLDFNKNGLWDTGNYINHLQPEKVYFFPSKINIRSKWEIEEEWDL